MIIVWAISWWYGAGWLDQLSKLKQRLDVSYDYFSIGLLARTLFAPFRQISAGKVNGPIGLRWRAFVDKLLSRVIGAFVRTILIITGAVWMLCQVLVGLAIILLWSIVPFVPFVGFIMMLSGWVPVWG